MVAPLRKRTDLSDDIGRLSGFPVPVSASGHVENVQAPPWVDLRRGGPERIALRVVRRRVHRIELDIRHGPGGLEPGDDLLSDSRLFRSGPRSRNLRIPLAGIVYHHILRSNPSESVFISGAVEAVKAVGRISGAWNLS